MKMLTSTLTLTVSAAILTGALFAQAPAATAPPAAGQAPPAAGRGRGGPAIVSPQIEADGRVTFRVLAPDATTVTVGGDINGSLVPDPTARRRGHADAAPPRRRTGGGRGGTPAVDMMKGENGVWTGTTVRAVKPGAWRYTFTVDGVTTVDVAQHANARPARRRSRACSSCPGDFSETRDVPHGAVASVRYVASALGNARREMYVYTPPGYEKGTRQLSGALSDSRRRRHRDLLVHRRPRERHPRQSARREEGLPMIVVMPSGWTPSGGQVMTVGRDQGSLQRRDVEGHHSIRRVATTARSATPESRALSGLSMGGIQTLNVGLHNLGTFRYLAVMSSGWTTDADRDWFYKSEAAKIPTTTRELKLFWWGWGETDIARANGLAVIDKFKSQGVRIETLETPGGHEWRTGASICTKWRRSCSDDGT